MQPPPSNEEGSVDTGERFRAPPGVLARLTARAEIMVGLGASAGVLLRYLIGQWTAHHIPGPYPTGTFAINLLGCLLIGIIQSLFLDLGFLRRPTQLLLAVGFCGGFTTFSTFSVETVQLIEGGHPLLALTYQVGSLVGGLIAVGCGIGIAVLGVRVLGTRGRTA